MADEAASRAVSAKDKVIGRDRSYRLIPTLSPAHVLGEGRSVHAARSPTPPPPDALSRAQKRVGFVGFLGTVAFGN